MCGHARVWHPLYSVVRQRTRVVGTIYEIFREGLCHTGKVGRRVFTLRTHGKRSI